MIAQDVLVETQDAALPLVHYPTACAGVLAAGLAGKGVAIYARIDDWRKGQR